MSISTTMQVSWIALLLGLSACVGPPWILEESPSDITLRWYPDEVYSSFADSVAQTHCASESRNAELVSYTQDGSAQIGKYRCR
jgi:hypothetical protein